MKGMVAWFGRNHVAANLLLVCVIILGAMTWPRIVKEVFPETSVDMVSVTYIYPGASPEDTEDAICKRVEEKLEGLDGMDRLNSVAAEGVATFLIESDNTRPTRDLLDDVKSKVDTIDDLPEEVERPIVEEMLLETNVMSIAISADMPEAKLRELAEDIRDDIKQFEYVEKGLLSSRTTRVTQAELYGIRPYEMSIEVSENTLRTYNLTFDAVANAIRAASIDLPGGNLKTSAGEIRLRVQDKKRKAEAFRAIPIITRPDGAQIRLGEIATVKDDFEDIDLISTFDKKPVILLQLYRTGDQDTLAIAKAARAYIKKAKENLPEGVELKVWGDYSKILKGRLELLGKNATYGLILVLCILTLFLRLKLAFWVCVGIPVSFFGGIYFMPILGISVNVISLFGFILVLGIVVDDAIVVAENVYSRIQRGEDPHKASIAGTQEVAVVVTFGVLTTIMAFTPMLMISGVSGKFFRNIPLVVIPVLVFSIIESKFILPVHLTSLSRKPKENLWTNFQQFFARGLENFAQKVYQPFLLKALHYRYVVIAAFLGIFAISVTLLLLGWVKFFFMPAVDADNVVVQFELPRGAPFSQTKKAGNILTKGANKIAEDFKFTNKDGEEISVVKHLMVSIGSQPFKAGHGSLFGEPTGSHLGEVNLELFPAEERGNISAEQLSIAWRKYVGNIPGVIKVKYIDSLSQSGDPISLQLSGRDIDELRAAASELKEKLREYEGVFDIGDTFRLGKRELIPKLKDSAKPTGVSELTLARRFRQGFYGEEVQSFQRGRNEVKVMLRYPKEERKSIFDVNKMWLDLPSGDKLPLESVADFEVKRGYSSIIRIDGRRSIDITASIDPAKANSIEIFNSLEKDPNNLPRILSKYPSINYRATGEERDRAESMSDLGRGAIIAFIGIYILLAIPLKSYFQPFIIMSAIPFGLVGALFGHILLGYNFSIMSLCGIVALMGVVVNDSLVLVDYVNRHHDEEKDIVQAAWKAGVKRFRPIILTSLTTFCGLTPIILEKSMQARFLVPMAISLGFGVLFATLITLVLVPSLYIFLHDIRGLIAKYFAKDKEAKPAFAGE